MMGFRVIPPVPGVSIAAPPLINTGLVVRYFIDEAASGTGPTQVLDASANAYHLDEIDYGSGNFAYTEVGGNRGLESIATSGTHHARKAMADSGDAVRTALEGTTAQTIEIVFDGDAFDALATRIFGINDRVAGAGTFILRATGLTTYNLRWGTSTTSDFDPGSSVRMVLHVVVDTNQGAQNDRVKFALNGGTLAQVTNTLGVGVTLSIPAAVDLLLCGRQNAGAWARQFDGILYYAAIYNVAMSQADIVNNYNVLTVNDDVS